jgi:molecular chaperone DnaJ
VAQHHLFTREGYDVHIDVPISLSKATLGGRVTVPTLDGTQTVSIAPGTQPGTSLLLPSLELRDTKVLEP